MEIANAIQILHERRKGLDMVQVTYERRTHFAKPSKKDNDGSPSDGGCQIAR